MDDPFKTDLTLLLLETGLLQFGRFAQGADWRPYRLNLEMLPSYPDVLEQIIEWASSKTGKVDHLVCLPSALPFGVGLSLRTSVPLVYSRGTQDAPVFDLVGAYDIGHPAALLANDLTQLEDVERLWTEARCVGLDIRRVLVIVDEGQPVPEKYGLEALLLLPDMVRQLIATRRLPAGHGQSTLDWLNRRHPD